MDWKEETIFCRKRFMDWVKETDPYFHIKEIEKYISNYKSYITHLDPIQLMQEWRVGSDWKRREIRRLWRFYEERYGEIWYPKPPSEDI